MKKLLLAALLLAPLFLGASPAYAAIAFDNASSGSAISSPTDTFSLAVGSVTNRVLWVGFIVNSTVTLTSSVTYAGTTMTETANSPLNGGQDLYMYYLANPASGTNNVVITMLGSVSEIHACAASYAGGAQTGIPDSITSVSSSGTSATLTTTTVANNAWMVGLFRNNSTGNGTAGTGTTQRCSVGGQVSFDDSNMALTPAGSHSIQETFSNTSYFALGVSMAPFATPAVTSGVPILLNPSWW